MPLPSLLESLGQVFSFLWSEILCGNEVVGERTRLHTYIHTCIHSYIHLIVVIVVPFVHQVAAAIGAKMNASNSSYSIVTVLMETTSLLLPKVETDIPAFKASLEQPFKEFEDKLALFHFAESSDVKAAPSATLSWYLSDLGARYVEIRRREILERARELVLSDYHNTMIAAGDAMDGALISHMYTESLKRTVFITNCNCIHSTILKMTWHRRGILGIQRRCWISPEPSLCKS
jgi:hypothetical protein